MANSQLAEDMGSFNLHGNSTSGNHSYLCFTDGETKVKELAFGHTASMWESQDSTPGKRARKTSHQPHAKPQGAKATWEFNQMPFRVHDLQPCPLLPPPKCPRASLHTTGEGLWVRPLSAAPGSQEQSIPKASAPQRGTPDVPELALRWALTLSWLSITPLGLPMVPDV